MDAWFNGRSLPPVEVMVPFASRWGLTLDWIYKGDPSGLPLSLNIRLVAAAQGETVPASRRSPVPEDEPPADWAVPSEVSRVQRRKPARRKPKAILP